MESVVTARSVAGSCGVGIQGAIPQRRIGCYGSQTKSHAHAIKPGVRSYPKTTGNNQSSCGAGGGGSGVGDRQGESTGKLKVAGISQSPRQDAAGTGESLRGELVVSAVDEQIPRQRQCGTGQAHPQVAEIVEDAVGIQVRGRLCAPFEGRAVHRCDLLNQPGRRSGVFDVELQTSHAVVL